MKKIKFNVIDIIVVILLALVLVLAGWKLASRRGSGNADTPMVQVTYQYKVEGVAPELYDECKTHLPSPLMASGALVGGQIEDVEKETYYILNEDGEWVEDPNHVTLIFTATTMTPKSSVMTTKVGDQEVRVGKTDYILKSEFIEFAGGTIIDVDWTE